MAVWSVPTQSYIARARAGGSCTRRGLTPGSGVTTIRHGLPCGGCTYRGVSPRARVCTEQRLVEDGDIPTLQPLTLSLQLLLQVFRFSRWIVVPYLIHP